MLRPLTGSSFSLKKGSRALSLSLSFILQLPFLSVLKLLLKRGGKERDWREGPRDGKTKLFRCKWRWIEKEMAAGASINRQFGVVHRLWIKTRRLFLVWDKDAIFKLDYDDVETWLWCNLVKRSLRLSFSEIPLHGFCQLHNMRQKAWENSKSVVASTKLLRSDCHFQRQNRPNYRVRKSGPECQAEVVDSV